MSLPMRSAVSIAMARSTGVDSAVDPANLRLLNCEEPLRLSAGTLLELADIPRRKTDMCEHQSL